LIFARVQIKGQKELDHIVTMRGTRNDRYARGGGVPCTGSGRCGLPLWTVRMHTFVDKPSGASAQRRRLRRWGRQARHERERSQHHDLDDAGKAASHLPEQPRTARTPGAGERKYSQLAI